MLKANERSEAINLIKASQLFFEKNDLIFKSASGELSLSKRHEKMDKRANVLFPDVLFFSDLQDLDVALGWEIKMPDVNINDKELYNNAVDKANRLSTNAFVLWNFNNVVIYIRNSDGENEWKQIYFKNIGEFKRSEVSENRKIWTHELEETILILNNIFIKEEVEIVNVKISMETLILDLTEKYSIHLSDFYKKNGNRIFMAKIRKWFNEEALEFSNNQKESDEEILKLYAKYILINWLNRITFASLLKENYNVVRDALKVIVHDKGDIKDLKEAFNIATSISDFYTIMYVSEEEANISESIFDVIKEYAKYMYTKNLTLIPQEDFQNMLETLISISKRELMGLYTTPPKLANLLVKCVIEDASKKILEPCVGSGTIAKEAIKLVENNNSLIAAHKNVWASDKYKLPLQIANISVSDKNSLNLANIIYQKDFLSQELGDKIYIVNPKDGKVESKVVEEFGYIISNLPFIRSERIDLTEKQKMKNINEYLDNFNVENINLKHDWFHFGIIKAHSLLEDNGKCGFIISNSWLKTKDKKNFVNILNSLFHVETIIISGDEKWFENVNVITTIVILRKRRTPHLYEDTMFVKLTQSLKTMSNENIDSIADSILLKEKNALYKSESYTYQEINKFINRGMSLNVLFNEIKWFYKLESKLIPMIEVFNAKRGVKSTNDSFFYDIYHHDKIEEEFIKPLIKGPDGLGFIGSPNSNVLVIRENIEELESKNKSGVLNYLKMYENQPKTKSQNLLDYWYQLPKRVYGDFITSLNPDRRLFWSKISRNEIVNQRLTVFQLKEKYLEEKDFIHALLNSYIGQFMIEASGFGRGLGALDTTKNGIMETSMLDFRVVDEKFKYDILKLWEQLSCEKVPFIEEQLVNEEWIFFNKVIFDAFGIRDIFEDVRRTLKDSVISRRLV